MSMPYICFCIKKLDEENVTSSFPLPTGKRYIELFLSDKKEKSYEEQLLALEWLNDIKWLLPSGIVGLLHLVWNTVTVLLFGMITVKKILFWILLLIPIILKMACKKEKYFFGLFG